MMVKEIPLKLIIDTMSNEKGVSKEIILEAIKAALVTATKKKYGMEIDIRVDIDPETGEYRTFREWTVVADPQENEVLEFPLAQITLSAAQVDSPEIQEGEKIEEELESIDFGRIDAQNAKQVIVQKVREAERSLIADEYRQKIGELITGVVKKTTRDSIIIDLGGNAEGLLKKDNLLPRESFRPGDKVRAHLEDVQTEVRGPQIILSRTCNDMLRELFKIEVPEVGEGIIEIKAAAREPGVRAKIAVKTNDGRLDPVGACVGMRGARVQAVSNELGGERVDIVLWDDNPAQFAMNAMAPAELVSITLDEDANTMDIAVKEEHLSQAIGRGGQNVKLAGGLTGWTLKVMGDEEAQEKSKQESQKVIQEFVDKLVVDEEVAQVLVEEGFSSIEEVAYVPIQEMLEIDGFDEEIVDDLRNRAKDALLTSAIAVEEKGDGEVTKKSNDKVDSVDGVSEDLVQKLSANKIISRDDLAELSTDDLVEFTDLSAEEAGKIIMAARAHWFVDEK